MGGICKNIIVKFGPPYHGHDDVAGIRGARRPFSARSGWYAFACTHVRTRYTYICIPTTIARSALAIARNVYANAYAYTSVITLLRTR